MFNKESLSRSEPTTVHTQDDNTTGHTLTSDSYWCVNEARGPSAKYPTWVPKQIFNILFAFAFCIITSLVSKRSSFSEVFKFGTD